MELSSPTANEVLKQQFNEAGYCIIDQAFNSADLIAFQTALRQAILLELKKTDSASFDSHIPFLQSANGIDYGLKVLRSINPIHISMVQMTVSRTPEFFRLTANTKVAAIVRELLDLPVEGLLYEISNGVVFTIPNDESNKHDSNLNLDWHRDTFYTIPRGRFVQMWGPLLHHSTETIGTLQVCPGSHKNGIGQQRYNPAANFSHRYVVDSIEIEKYSPKSIVLELGQLMIFDGRLIHGSGRNSSDSVRCSILGLFHDASAQAFKPTAIEYKYLDQTPEAYFYEVFKDEAIKPIINEQAAFPAHFD